MISKNSSNSQPCFTGSDLSTCITERIKELAEATDKARLSEEMRRYLEAASKFHQYSVYNIWCILMACPHATRVAGYQKWKEFNRYVRKGEKGIPILAPILVYEDPGDPSSRQVLRGFRVAYVFDVSQTDGEPLPPPPEWKSPEKNTELNERLLAFAKSKGISVTFKHLSGEIQGISKGGAIEIDPSAGTKTLIHEIAHELMHRDRDFPDDPSIRELEAESVAYVVARHFFITGLASPNYLSLHQVASKDFFQYLERIRITSTEILMAIDQDVFS